MAKEKKSAAKAKGSWWAGMKSEFRKIIWPTKDDVAKQTVAVTLVTVVVAIMIAIIDAIVKYGIDFLISL